MKKVLIVLSISLLIALGSASALDPNTLTLTAEIYEVGPQFTIKGGLSKSSFTTESGGTLLIDGDGKVEIQAFFQLFQSTVTKYSGSVSYSITATDMASPTVSIATAPVSLVQAECEVMAIQDVSITPTFSGATAMFEVDYSGTTGLPVGAQAFAIVVYKWVIANLPAANDYGSTVTLSVATP